MTYFALEQDRPLWNARDLAGRARLPQPTVTKILKTLARGGLLISHRGVKGGYCLARRATEISIADVISALEGPVAITQCCEAGGGCEQEAFCPTRDNWQLIDRVVRQALGAVTLDHMSRRLPPEQLVEIERRLAGAAAAALEGSLAAAGACARPSDGSNVSHDSAAAVAAATSASVGFDLHSGQAKALGSDG